ncbi:MAG: hypothetical protein Barrevirus13_8 [Barrevirus sp.]|uniref:Uncharacterized protein n=1 Tax=Barrevirus sp. TaxID=2487763 RepID=A0A3G4ZUM1_9VIRU|nr:MAG: hypothetical protein Barrevirus13_8 [Barrevirus sp.]
MQKGNWYKYKVPRNLIGPIFTFLNNNLSIQKKEKDIARISISCKTSVNHCGTYYKILIRDGFDFICLDMSKGTYSYIYNGYDEREIKKVEKLKYSNRYKIKGIIIKDNDYTKLNELCYKFVDSIKEQIPNGRITQDGNRSLTKVELYLLLKRIKETYRKGKYRIDKNNSLFIFLRIALLPKDLYKCIINYL